MIDETEIQSPNFVSESRKYDIPHFSIWISDSYDGKDGLESRESRLYEGQSADVETVASDFWESQSFSTVRGEDAYLFFRMLSYDYPEWKYGTIEGWVGENAESMLSDLKSLVRDAVEARKPSDELIEQAGHILQEYYSKERGKKRTHGNLSERMKHFDKRKVFDVMRFCKSKTLDHKRGKGAPDLFVYDDSDFAFVEVKSMNDSLSRSQYEFFRNYLETVGRSVWVMRVLPDELLGESRWEEGTTPRVRRERQDKIEWN